MPTASLIPETDRRSNRKWKKPSGRQKLSKPETVTESPSSSVRRKTKSSRQRKATRRGSGGTSTVGVESMEDSKMAAMTLTTMSALDYWHASLDLGETNNRLGCSVQEDYERDCMNGGRCFAVMMRTPNRRIQRVVGCSCPPEWKGESCESRHFDYSVWGGSNAGTAGLTAGVVLGFVVLFAGIVLGTWYCWFRKKRRATQSTLKRPLKAETSVISGGGQATSGTADHERSSYGNSNTWASVAPCSEHHRTNTFNDPTVVCGPDAVAGVQPLIQPTNSFATFGEPTTNRTPSSPTSSTHAQCPTCAAVSAGMQNISSSPTTSPAGKFAANSDAARQASLYDNCPTMPSGGNRPAEIGRKGRRGSPMTPPQLVTKPAYFFG